MTKSLMEKARDLILILSEKTGIPQEDIKKDDKEVLALFQAGSEIHERIGLSMIPMFDTAFANRLVKAAKPECYEDVRKIRAFLNEGGPMAFTTLDMLEKGAIRIKDMLTDQTDYEEFMKVTGLSMEDMPGMQAGHVISRETAEHFADITWKLAFYKIHCEEIYSTYYKEEMREFYD